MPLPSDPNKIIITDADITRAGTPIKNALDGKAPSSHMHPASQISDATAAGRTLLTAADAAAQRTALGVQQSLAGTGSPLGVVTPARAGLIYVDTAMTLGARQWMSTGTTNTSWVVTNGDTRWRDITPLLPLVADDPSAGISGGALFLRRVNERVYLHFAELTIATDQTASTALIGAGKKTTTLPVGFRVTNNAHASERISKSNAVITQYVVCVWSGSSLTVFGYYSPAAWQAGWKAADPLRGVMSWITDDPWPTTLPGTAG